MIEEEFEAEYNIRRRHPGEPAALCALRRRQRRGAGVADSAGSICAYGETAGERLDFFPAARADAPLFLFIHGGYWRALDKNDVSFIAPGFVAAGIAVVLINYDLAPKVTVEEIVAQTQRAIGWTHANAAAFGFDRGRLVVGGHSAGRAPHRDGADGRAADCRSPPGSRSPACSTWCRY